MLANKQQNFWKFDQHNCIVIFDPEQFKLKLQFQE